MIYITYCMHKFLLQDNLAAGFVYSLKDAIKTFIYLVNSPDSKVLMTPTIYPQGKLNEPMYGSPLTIFLGFPPAQKTLNTIGRIQFQSKVQVNM